MPQVGIAGNIQEVYGSQVWANWFALGPSARNLKTYWLFEDFVEYPTNDALNYFFGTVSGAGAVITFVTPTNRLGVLYQGTGTTAAGYATILTNTYAVRGGDGIFTYEADIQVPILSTVAEEFAVRCGFGDTAGADQTDGIYFEYDRAASVNWQYCSAIGGVRSKSDSGIVVSTGWVRLKVVLNAAATLASYYINGTLIGTLAANLPSGVAFGILHHIIKSAGLTARALYTDWIWGHFDLTTSR